MSNEQSIMEMPGVSENCLLWKNPAGAFPFEYNGIPAESGAYRTSAWIGTALSTSPVIDVVGPDAMAFLQSICVNDFTNLKYTGIRHAVICNEEGYILTDGVVIRLEEDRYRTYWLNPPIASLASITDLDVHLEDFTGQEYFIQVQGEKSLEILEDAFQADLHDIMFAKHRTEDMDGRTVRIIRLGMSGNLAYEIHGPMADYAYVYDKVIESGRKFGAELQGLHTYNLFNHTEAGFPNINLHYPMPWRESGEGLNAWVDANPFAAVYNFARRLTGSMGEDAEARFMTPFDVGWGFLVKFNHEFTGRAALEEAAKNPRRTPVTLEWNAEDVGKVFATRFMPGEEPCEDISIPTDAYLVDSFKDGRWIYRADKVLADGNEIGVSSGRIVSYNYNAMISLGFIDPAYAEEGRELTVVWGTPGTRQMDVRVKVARFPYNGDFVRNEDKDVEEIPHPAFA